MTDTATLQHDPHTKKRIQESLYEFIYKPVIAKFKERLDTIIINNALIGGFSHRSFLYKGELYTCDGSSPPRRSNRLMPQLHGQMDAYLRDLQELNTKEVPYVVGFINAVLNSSNNLPDYLRLLPDAIHPPLIDLINSCPCHNHKLTDEQADALLQKQDMGVTLMKKRLMMNLII